jgi:hypothetical protein
MAGIPSCLKNKINCADRLHLMVSLLSAKQKHSNMKYYYSDTIFTFGKYKGKTLDEVMQLDPDYVDWCLANLDHFALGDDEFTSNLKTSSKRTRRFYDDDNYEDDWSDDDSFGSYGQKSFDIYGGGPTGHLSDDFIDNVLDGDPMNYWNID